VYFRKPDGLQGSNFIYFSYIFYYNHSENMNVSSGNSFRGFEKGTQWRICLRHCATSRKIAVLIPDYVIDLILPAAMWAVTEMGT
jgi:hypothetical protein